MLNLDFGLNLESLLGLAGYVAGLIDSPSPHATGPVAVKQFEHQVRLLARHLLNEHDGRYLTGLNPDDSKWMIIRLRFQERIAVVR